MTSPLEDRAREAWMPSDEEIQTAVYATYQPAGYMGHASDSPELVALIRKTGLAAAAAECPRARIEGGIEALSALKNSFYGSDWTIISARIISLRAELAALSGGRKDGGE